MIGPTAGRHALIVAAWAGLFGLAVANLPVAWAADLTVLDVPGAVHLAPSTEAAPKRKSTFSFPPLISPADAAAASTAGVPASATLVPAVRLTGIIRPGDAEKMRGVLDKLAASPSATSGEPLTTIELSSMGGSLTEGFEIGAILRKYKLVAVVRQRDLCLSSCALAFVGGNVHEVPPSYPTRCNVEIGGKVGFHNFFLNPNGLREDTVDDPVASRLRGFADARGGAALLVRYAGDMGLPPSFVASLMGRPVDDFQYVETVGQFLSFGVCPIGLQRPPIALDEQAKNVCGHSIRSAAPRSTFDATLLPPAETKRYLLERLQTYMQSLQTRGRLAGLLANGAVMRVAEEIDRLYDDLRATGMALPDIVGPTFEIGTAQSGKYETTCFVSVSPDDPDKYDVVVRGPRGLTDPPRLPPGNARRLFLFDSDTVINPRP